MIKSSEKFWRLEAVRGFAAFYVFLHHAAPHDLTIGGLPVGLAFRFGQEAVILFFLLSGFVIHYSFAMRPVGAKRYFFNRIARLYIPLLAVFALTWTAGSLVAQAPILPDPVSLFGNLVMVQDLGNLKPGTIVEPFLDNAPLWSLSYEFWFYVLYFMIVARARSLTAATRFVAVFATIAALAYFAYPHFALRIVFYLALWWSGVLLAQTYLENAALTATDVLRASLLPLIVTAALAFSFLLFGDVEGELSFGKHPVVEFRHFAAALVILGAGLLWNRAGWRGFDAVFAVFTPLAPISYGLYIVHYPILRSLGDLGFQAFAMPTILSALVLSIGAAWVVERGLYPPLRVLLLRWLFADAQDPAPDRISAGACPSFSDNPSNG